MKGATTTGRGAATEETRIGTGKIIIFENFIHSPNNDYIKIFYLNFINFKFIF